MSRKQKDYLDDLLKQDEALETVLGEPASPAPSPAPDPAPRVERRGAMTLLGRESALARVASGEVRQVTQLLLDPARVRIWPGNARIYAHLTEENCRDLIDSILAENGQKVPAVVRRIEDDPSHDYEVIVGTRRHFAVSWLRAHNYPETMFVAQVAPLDDEAAFRLADIENRARRDVSDIERARNYAWALQQHYGGHQTRMAERLHVSKGWLSKLIKIASVPDAVIAAFASPGDLQLNPAYGLAQALDAPLRARAIAQSAKSLAARQTDLRRQGLPGISAQEVIRTLMSSHQDPSESLAPFSYRSRHGRDALSVVSSNRQGVTIRLHAGSGADTEELVTGLRKALDHLENQGRGLKR